MKVTVHFCKSDDLGGRILRLFLMSKWNHVAVQIGNAVYESVSGAGVIKRRPADFSKAWDRISSVEVYVPSQLAALRFLNDQLGKPYDWKAILAFPFRGSWQDRAGWFCSELVYECLRVGAALASDRLPANRITPRDLWVAIPADEGFR